VIWIKFPAMVFFILVSILFGVRKRLRDEFDSAGSFGGDGGGFGCCGW
jgi:hypothetical protein